MCHALAGEGFTGVLVVSPQHIKAVKGHKTGAKDCARIAERPGCGLLQGSYMPAPEPRDLRDLTRYRTKTVQARGSGAQRPAKTLETAGVKPGSAAPGITGAGPTMMIGQLISGERRGAVMAGLAFGRARPKIADLPMTLEGRFSGHQKNPAAPARPAAESPPAA